MLLSFESCDGNLHGDAVLGRKPARWKLYVHDMSVQIGANQQDLMYESVC